MPRPSEFVREDVMESAMILFWEKGYQATSMSDLSRAMDLRPGSIYGAFGSKHELLMELIEFYVEKVAEKVQATFAEAPSEREGFRRMFHSMIGDMVCDEKPRGCLLINLLIELSTIDEKAAARLRSHLDQKRKFFEAILVVARQKGTLKNQNSDHDLALFLMGTVYSIRVMGKARAPRCELEIFCDQALEHVFGPENPVE